MTPRPRLRVLAAVATLLGGLAIGLGAAPPARATPGPGVFFLGDSVLVRTASALNQLVLPAYPGATIDGAVCRGLVTSCTYAGATTPPTTGLDEIKTNAATLGDVVVIELGYNDQPGAAQIDKAMALLTQEGVPLVVWLNLTTLNRPDMAPVNAALQAATGRWPTLRVADWDGFSHAHPEWFVPDDGVGVHPTDAGATALGGFIRTQLDAIPGIGVPPPAAQHCSASVAIGTPAAGPAAAPASTPPASGLFTGSAPQRLLDTRTGRPVGAGRSIELQVAGRSGVPASATAAALNLTVVDPCGAGFATVYPCGAAAPPLASNANYVAADVRPNLAVARLGTGGRVCIFTMTQTDLVVDLMGWFGPTGTSKASAVNPVRVLDTRQAGGAITAGAARPIAVEGAGRAPGDATAAVLNVTASQPTAAGYLTLWPAAADGTCDPANRPATSNVNYHRAETVPNLAMVAIGGQGHVCVYSFVTTDVVADLGGWFGPTGATASAAEPTRVLDTRTAGVPVGAGGVVGITVTGGSLAPAAAVGVILNVTAVQPSAAGFVTVWPAAADGSCNAASRPLASNVNVTAGEVIANLAETAIGGLGRVCVFSMSRTHVVADLDGWIA